MILLIWGNKLFAGCKEALILYGFMVSVWLFRVALAIVKPWPLEPVSWEGYAQFAGATLIMVLLLAPLVKLAVIQGKPSNRTGRG